MNSTHIAPEQPVQEPTAHRLIVCLLCSRWEPRYLDDARVLIERGAIDWRDLVQLAIEGGVAPLLYDAAGDRGVLPDTVEVRLRQEYLSASLNGAILMAQIEAILRRLNDAGLPAILLKGAALIETTYQHAALRPMSDADLLIHRADVLAAVELLQGLGFVTAHAEARSGAAIAYENELLMVRRDSPGVQVELHWSLFDSPHHQTHVDMAWFWQSAQPIQVGRTPARVLGMEAQLLHLCGHLWLHHRRQSKLLWQHDIMLLLADKADAIGWYLVIEQAQRLDLVLSLQGVLDALATDWPMPVPESIKPRIALLRPTAAERLAAERVTAAQASVAGRFRTDLAGLPGWQARLGYLWINLFPSVAYMCTRYHIHTRWLAPFYYPYRWFDGTRQLRSSNAATKTKDF